MHIIYSFLSWKLAKLEVFRHYQLSLCQANTVNNYRIHVNFQDIECQLQENILH